MSVYVLSSVPSNVFVMQHFLKDGKRLLNSTNHINVQLPFPNVNCKNVLIKSYEHRRSGESCLYVADC